MCLLGLDIGTSGCKAGIFDSEGNPVAFAYKEYPLHFPGEGLMEMDIQQVKASLKSVVSTVCKEISNKSIEGIGITSLGDVITAVDSTGQAVHNPIVDFDPRGRRECQELVDALGADYIFEITGVPPTWTNSICKILWLLKNRPEVREKTWKYLCFEDLAMLWLGIEPFIDYSLASRTMAFDFRQKKWSTNILSIVDLDTDHFANLCPSGQHIGEVGKKESVDFGLRAGTPVISGAHDWVCASVGAGAIFEDNSAVDVTGTMEGILIACKAPFLDPEVGQAGYANFCHAVPDMYMAMGFLSTAGVLLRWYRDNFAIAEQAEARESNKDIYDVIIDLAHQNKRPLIVVPHFSGSGTPHFDPMQAGSILGLTLDSTRHNIAGGILEGLAFELRINLDYFSTLGREVEEVRVVGGGAKSPKWLQLKANVTGRKVRTPVEPEASCKGAALLAGSGIGKYSIEEGVEKWIRKWKEFTPDPKARKEADRRFIQYLHARQAMKRFYHNLAS